jgi:hypothetical protein
MTILMKRSACKTGYSGIHCLIFQVDLRVIIISVPRAITYVPSKTRCKSVQIGLSGTGQP